MANFVRMGILLLLIGAEGEPMFAGRPASEYEDELATTEQPRRTKGYQKLVKGDKAAVPVLTWLLENGRVEARRLAASMMGPKGPVGRRPLVRALLEDEDPEVRREAYLSLRCLGPNVLPELRRALEARGLPDLARIRLGPVWVGTHGLAAAAWSPNGREVAAAGNDGVVTVWSLDGEVARRIRFADQAVPTRLVWSPDGGRIAVGDKLGARVLVVSRWEGEEPHVVALFPFDGHDLSWSPQGSLLAGTASGGVAFWSPEKGLSREEMAKLCVPVRSSEKVWSLAFSPDGRLLAIGKTCSIQLTEVAGRKHLTTLEVDDSPANILRWHPKGARLASGHLDGVIRIWSVEDGTEKSCIKSHDSYVGSLLAWSPSGLQLACGGDSRFRILDVATPDGGREYVSDQLFVETMAWSPGGKEILTAGRDGSILLWPTAPPGLRRDR